MKITENTIKRALRTFVQTAVGYIVINIVAIDFTASKDLLKTALIGLGVSAVSAGVSAVMNLDKRCNDDI